MLACLLSGDDRAMELYVCICIGNAAASIDAGRHLLPICVGLGLHTTVPLHSGLEGEKIKTSWQKDSKATSRRLHLTACITWSDAETPEAVLGRVSRGGKMCYHS
jgi:hypothetical protein